MKAKFLFVGVLCCAMAGCAASNGGGHVVGNPIMSSDASKKLAKSKESSCGLHHHDHKGSCGASCADCCKSCDHEGGTCGGSEGSCSGEHKK